MRRAGTGVLTAIGCLVLLAGCGRASAAPARIVSYTQHHCQTSPPDVLALADVPFGGDAGAPPPTPQERDIENHYLYAHWGVATDGIYGAGHFYMGFTDDAQRHLAELRRLLPDPTRVRAYCTPFSNAELGSARDIIARDTALTARGLHVSVMASGGLDGRIALTFIHLGPGDEQWIRDRYGPIVGPITEGQVTPN